MIGGGRGDKDGDVVFVRRLLEFECCCVSIVSRAIRDRHNHSFTRSFHFLSIRPPTTGASDEGAVRDDEQIDELHGEHRRRRVSARQVPLGRAAMGRLATAAHTVVRMCEMKL